MPISDIDPDTDSDIDKDADMTPSIEFNNVIAGYKDLMILNGLNLTVRANAITLLIGPNDEALAVMEALRHAAIATHSAPAPKATASTSGYSISNINIC